MLVSFVVPVYNGEKTIGRCLSSICNLREKNIEIIAVNDGSTDCTKEILENLAQVDKRIKVVNIPNSGVSNARNVAMKLVSGEYIAFSDCDDIVLSAYDDVFEIIKRQPFDIVVCNYVHHKETIKENFSREKLQLGNNSCQSLYEEVAIGQFNSIWCNVYRRNIIEKNSLKFDSKMKMGEDAKFNLDYVDLCKSCYYYDKPVYEYIDNSASAMHSYKASYLRDHIILYDRQLDFLKKHKLTEGFEIDDYMVSRIFGILYYSVKAPDNELLKQFENSILHNDLARCQLGIGKSKIKQILINSKMYRISCISNIVVRLLS